MTFVTTGMLQGLRALDLTDREPQLCGRILADLGADVIRVERPGGDRSRHFGPFHDDAVHPERSLWWFFLNANKRGITLDLETADGIGLFKGLAKSADVVIESFPPGDMARRGLDYPALAAINPRIVLTSITPFGQTGPYQDYKASELVLNALGVFMFGNGAPDRPPLKPNYPLAGMTAAIAASSATMVAHYSCRKSGKGQHIDVSAQAGLPWLTGSVGAWWQAEHVEMPRRGPALGRRPDLVIRFFWPCRDGHVVFQFFGGVVGTRSNKALAQWMAEEGMGDDYFRSIDWDKLDLYQVSQDVITRLEESIGTFFLTKGREELSEEGTRRGMLLGRMDNMRDLSHNAQLASGGFWKEIEHPEMGTSLTYAGRFVRSSIMDCGIRRRAPLIGEHNHEVYAEIGVSREELLALNQAGVV